MSAAEFRAALERLNWTQQKAAEVLAVRQPRISEWATGRFKVPRYIAAHVRTLEELERLKARKA